MIFPPAKARPILASSSVKLRVQSGRVGVEIVICIAEYYYYNYYVAILLLTVTALAGTAGHSCRSGVSEKLGDTRVSSLLSAVAD